MQMISYWKNWTILYKDDGLSLIWGWYDHKNQEGVGEKALGVYWGDHYPQSRGVLSPCVIPPATRSAILSGLLHQAVLKGQTKQVEDIIAAIKFFEE